MVTTFITSNYWYVRDLAFTRNKTSSYADQTTAEEKQTLANALSNSRLFQPIADLTLYPLLTVTIASGFESDQFFLLNPVGLANAEISHLSLVADLDTTQFPPILSWSGIKCPTASWLGVYSPSPLISKKMSSAILGALALMQASNERYSFSMRKMSGGYCTIKDASFSIHPDKDPHTPPLMHNIAITERDHGWLTILAKLFESKETQSAQQIRALEYFYRAWFLQSHERFPILFMSLDSLVGATEKHTNSAIKFVQSHVGYAIDDKRLQELLKIRGAVIHGVAPDVSESEHYAKYYTNYKSDPIRDLELVVAKCIRVVVFGADQKCHASTNQALIEKLKTEGRLPKQANKNYIIPDHI